jgi:Tannase and feruloyl esterase
VLQIARLALYGVSILVCLDAVAAQQCAQLQGTAPTPASHVLTARQVPADAGHGLPSYCELTVQASSGPGSHITMVYRLPDNWNGKMLGIGGGGWAGNTYLLSVLPTVVTAASVLPRGYATAQTDAGHPLPEVQGLKAASDISWIPGNWTAVMDFSHLAVHQMTVLGKQVIAAYYGRPVEKSYFQGCSTGGRMGMMETQRYPDDYDGVIAGAPVYTLLVQSSSVVRTNIFNAPGAALDAAHLKLVNAAVLAACDAKDGLVDGIIADPRRCDWDPGKLQCAPGASPDSCLVPAQVNALRQAYTTVRTRSGVVGNYGLTRGSELAWNPFVRTGMGDLTVLNGNLGNLVPLMFGDPAFDLSKFDIQKHQDAVHKTDFAREYEANAEDLSRFFGHGGKLILWHGLNDPGPSPFATQDYYDRLVARKAGANVRFFAAPGVAHCGSGPGADRFDLLTALEDWVEKGTAPTTLVARNAAKGFERPLCAWPKLPAYTGGDPNSAASFACQ